MIQRQRLPELVSQQMAPQKMVQGLSHQLMAQKTVQELIPMRESLLKGISKLQRNYISITSPASQLQGDLSYPSSFKQAVKLTTGDEILG